MDTGGFFDNADTRALIAKLGTASDWVIYVGLGGTIDRTGMSWDGLVAGLLGEFGLDAETRSLVVRKNGPIRAATMVESLFRASAATEDEAIITLRAAIAKLLYGPNRSMAGKILPSLAQFALANAVKGQSVTFVTPNYDKYLHEAVTLACVGNPDKAGDLIVLDPDVATDLTNIDFSLINCFHLHGLVDGNDSKGIPVLGEQTYRDTTAASAAFLKEVFSNKNVLIVGSSVTDTPLVNALLDTVSTGKTTRRYAIQPLQSGEWQSITPAERRKMIEWNKLRLNAMRVEPVHPDYYIQVAQLFSEFERSVRFGDAAKMTLPRYKGRYSERLEKWWRTWERKTLSNSAEQPHAHERLRLLVKEVKEVVGIPASEAIKAELWVRWEPHASRMLALWASSTGTWDDIGSIHKAPIGLQGKYRAVDMFCSGAPKFFHADDSRLPLHQQSRWRSYFGMPVWLEGPGGLLAVGTIALASMTDAKPADASTRPGSIAETNLANLQKAISLMAIAGDELLSTEKSAD